MSEWLPKMASTPARASAFPSQISAPTLQYALLALIFAATVWFQTWNMRDMAVSLLYPDTVANEVFSVPDGGNTISRVYLPEAQRAGIRKGDHLLEVNGRPYNGPVDIARALASSHAGDLFTVKLASDGQTRIAAFKLPARIPGGPLSLNHIIYLLLGVIVPIFCIVLGFWTAVARPRDPLAWLLFALLLGFTQILLGTLNERWTGVSLPFGIIYRNFLGNTFPIWMLLFGIYFPEPFPRGAWRNVSRVAMWLIIPLLSLDMLTGQFLDLRGFYDYRKVAGLVHALAPLQPLVRVAAYSAIGFFTFSLAVKYRLATSPDAKRRLLLLYAGSFISLVPAISLTLVGIIKDVSPDELLPFWLVFIFLLLVLLFPLTLAYVIVVHKAMEIRVVVRQGLQYALAKNGVRILQIVASGLILYGAVSLANESNRNRPQKIALISAGVAAVFLLRRGADRLRAWTDKRFFRDAYNAEQILSDLSEEVRSMVESRRLLETVSQRIAESLHVRQIAVLLSGAGLYKPAYAIGYASPLNLDFPEDAVTVKQLRAERQPARIYLDDPDSWINRDSQVAPEEKQRLSELKAELLLPLSARDHLLGFISLGQKLSEEPYSGSDVRLLQSVAAQTGLALENARLTDAMAREMAQREKLNREIEIAREVQERLFPQQLNPVEGLDYFGACRPALGVGGDYYDFIVLPGGKLGIAIGDVSGKGISAALMMASLQASLRGQALVAPDNLAKIVANVNRLVYEASSANRYATFFYAQYDPASRQLTYVNAGHNPPVLLRKCRLHAQPGSGGHGGNGCECRVERLESGGVVIGLIPEVNYDQGSTTLEPGDMLFAYTDGVSEAMNTVDEEWGEKHMLETVETCNGLPAPEVIKRIFAAADEFAKGAPQFDDMTLVVARAV